MLRRIAFGGVVSLIVIGKSTAQEQPEAPPPAPGQSQSGGPVLNVPPVVVITPKEAEPAKPRPAPVSTGRSGAAGAGTGGQPGPNSQAAGVAAQAGSLDAARENILPKIGVNTYELDQATIGALPQGDNVPVDKLLLQAPGVYQDSAASGNLHIRNEHSNLQYRIDGIQLPDGVSGFGSFGNELDTSIIRSLNVVTGALPAQYGLRTAGLVDIQTRTLGPQPSGEISIYGGSHGTVSSNLQYGGISGNTEYYFTGRFTENGLGIENPTPSYDAIHDHTDQEKFFSYVSTVLPNNSRWTMITGASVGQYQIPTVPGQTPSFTLPSGATPASVDVNERQLEQNYYGILAFQQSVGPADYQISYFSRYSSLHYTPDLQGDLAYNGIATNVTRESFLNGIQADGSYKVTPDHTLRAGLVASVEHTNVSDSAQAFLGTLNPDGSVNQDPSLAIKSILDQDSKFGEIVGIYLQDEWKITRQLTLNTGLRFDQMWQYVDANQLSPRTALVYKPIEDTVLHAGYARYFTPPPQAVGAPENYALFNGTVAQAQVGAANPNALVAAAVNPIQPERSHYFDAGVTQVLAPGLEAGLDVYYKIATNLLDDGQFGQAYTLTAFNYAKANNEGLEAKFKYSNGGVLVYGNLAWARQVAAQFSSNQYLIAASDYIYGLTNYIHTDHSQTVSASAGISYPIWDNTKATMDMIYGSGLRDGDANTLHVPGYTQFNLGLAHEFILPDWKPFTVRFDVVNLFDHIYEIRDGSGIGVFAPQYGPRRGFFVGFSQKF